MKSNAQYIAALSVVAGLYVIYLIIKNVNTEKNPAGRALNVVTDAVDNFVDFTLGKKPGKLEDRGPVKLDEALLEQMRRTMREQQIPPPPAPP